MDFQQCPDVSQITLASFFSIVRTYFSGYCVYRAKHQSLSVVRALEKPSDTWQINLHKNERQHLWCLSAIGER